MLYNLLFPLADEYIIFNLFKYLTFRTGGAIMTALLISFLIGPAVIRWLRSKQAKGQPIRADGPETHFKKVGTPTMGGIMILFSVCLSTLLWVDLSNLYMWVALFVFLGFGTIGFFDDYLKLTKQNPNGLSGKLKLLFQFLIAGIACYAILQISGATDFSTKLAFPSFKNFMIQLGWFYIPFAIFVIVGASNAVNLTDGLDGLAIVPVMIAAGCFGIITYMVGNTVFSNYLQLHYIANVGELAIMCGALIGAGLGFLWYNAPPAAIFMGDTGSLAMGGFLGTISVMTKHEIVLAIVGGLFVLEALSVMIQVASFKLTGKRVFRMAPIHHHFEKKGWPESTIVVRFWIIAFILALVGLATLKLR